MADEKTLATEVHTVFKTMASHSNQRMDYAIARIAGTGIGSAAFYTTLAAIATNCDQLVDDIRASKLKQRSKILYADAVETLLGYIDFAALQARTTAELANESKAFEYLTLVDDFLEPLDYRHVTSEFLAKIAGEATSMLNELHESQIDERLKAFLDKQIRQFLWSIETYDILGIEGLSRAWGAMAAEIARSHGMHGSAKPEAKAWYKKAMPVIGTIGLAVTSVSATVEHADNLLTHGSHIVDVLGGGKPNDQAKASSDPG